MGRGRALSDRLIRDARLRVVCDRNAGSWSRAVSRLVSDRVGLLEAELALCVLLGAAFHRARHRAMRERAPRFAPR